MDVYLCFSAANYLLSSLIALVVIVDAVVSFLNTLWLKQSLLKQVKIIAKDNELNILRKQNKVTTISTKQG